MTTPRFRSKDASESRVLAFDFSADLDTGETLTGSPDVTVHLALGPDANPSAILAGGNAFDTAHKMFLVPVTGGTQGTEYLIKVVSNTSNAAKRLALSGVLPVT